MIVFDIDGTILDMRHMIHYVLKAYDEKNRTACFKGLQVEHIDVHENEIEKFVDKLHLPKSERQKILVWFNHRSWSREVISTAHRPYRGVLEVIRYFSILPNTFVGVNTGRPEKVREDTLRSLNILAHEHRLKFSSELLFMNPQNWNKGVPEAKVQGIRWFQNRGFKIFAVVDNEPDNLEAIGLEDTEKEILLLHAETIFQSKRTISRKRFVSGKDYDLTELVEEDNLPERVQFAWHGVNDELNLRQFLSSKIQWAEVDVRTHFYSGELISRHDSMKESPLLEDEKPLCVEKTLQIIKRHGKSAKLDFKEKKTIEPMVNILLQLGFSEEHLWFNGNIERVGERGFRLLACRFPKAIIQCPIDFLGPLILACPHEAKDILSLLGQWGINRFSLSFKTSNKTDILNQLDRWNYEVNIYNPRHLDEFLRAVLLLPRSVTADFNFPQWHYFGRGSGEKLRWHNFSPAHETPRIEGEKALR